MNISCVAMRHTYWWQLKKDKESKPASDWAFANILEKQGSWGDLNSFRGTLAFQSDQLERIWITTTMWHHERENSTELETSAFVVWIKKAFLLKMSNIM